MIRFQEDLIDKVRNLAKEKMTINQMAEVLQIKPTTVRYICLRHNIEFAMAKRLGRPKNATTSDIINDIDAGMSRKDISTKYNIPYHKACYYMSRYRPQDTKTPRLSYLGLNTPENTEKVRTMIAENKTNKQIAKEMNINVLTVASFIYSRKLRKLRHES